MPTNTEIISSLVAGSVPLDRDCPKSGQDVVNLVQDYVSVQSGTASGDGSNPNDSVAEQALNTANTALEGVQALTAAQKEVRSSGLIPVPSGDSNFSYSWTPPMPSTDYDVFVTYYAGAAGFVASNSLYNFRVLESSITINGVNLIFDNTPANSKVSIRAVQR
jgi:hypothetical protein